jgi:hypothetical protein
MKGEKFYLPNDPHDHKWTDFDMVHFANYCRLFWDTVDKEAHVSNIFGLFEKDFIKRSESN